MQEKEFRLICRYPYHPFNPCAGFDFVWW